MSSSAVLKANDFMIPYETIRSKYENQGVLGVGFDWVLELTSTNYVLVEPKSSYKIIMQHYQSLAPEIYKLKIERITEAAASSYNSHLQKIIGFSMQERKGGEKDLYVLYDYNEVASNFESYIQEQRSGDGIQEEEVYEFIYTCLDSFYLSCLNHMEYLTLNPYNIFVSRSQYQKFIIGNCSLTIAGKEKALDFSLPTDNFHSIKPLSRDANCTERALLFKVGMLVLYMIGTQDLVTFHNEFKSKISTQSIQFYLQHAGQVYSAQLISLLNDMLFLNEAIRPTLKSIIEMKSDKYFPRPLKFYQGTIMNNAFEFKGWVEWYNDPTSGELKKHMTGLGQVVGVFNGHFVQTRKYGYGLSMQPNGIHTWGNWENDAISHGILYNTVQRYIFIGEFKDETLSNASGSLIYLRDSNNQGGVLAYEGEFIDGKIVSGECWTLEGKYQGNFQDGLFEGDGVFIFRYPKSGYRIWEGPFHQGKFNGQGTLKKTDGQEIQARFNMGQRVDSQ
ncbi:hypothetical protein ABPG72_006320 [Tetrahymena utriculariae]